MIIWANAALGIPMGLSLLDLNDDVLNQIFDDLNDFDIGAIRRVHRKFADVGYKFLYRSVRVSYGPTGQRILQRILNKGDMRYVRNMHFTAPREIASEDPDLPFQWAYLDGNAPYGRVTRLPFQVIDRAAFEAMQRALQGSNLGTLKIEYPDQRSAYDDTEMVDTFDMLWHYLLRRASLPKLTKLLINLPIESNLQRCPNADLESHAHSFGAGLGDVWCVSNALLNRLDSLVITIGTSGSHTRSRRSHLGHTGNGNPRPDATPDALFMITEARNASYIAILDRQARMTDEEDPSPIYSGMHRPRFFLRQGLITSQRLEHLSLVSQHVNPSFFTDLISRNRMTLRRVRMHGVGLAATRWEEVLGEFGGCENLVEWECEGLLALYPAAAAGAGAGTTDDFPADCAGENVAQLSTEWPRDRHAYADLVRAVNQQRMEHGLDPYPDSARMNGGYDCLKLVPLTMVLDGTAKMGDCLS